MFDVFSQKNRILLRELIKTDFKLRYQGSAIGYLWSILKPLMTFTIMYIVFIRFLRLGGDVPHFPVALLLANVVNCLCSFRALNPPSNWTNFTS